MVRRITRRIVPLIGAVALLLNLAVAPQRARAVAVTAAVAASAAAILTACGVSYWAATQTDAIDYIAGKIDDYLASLDETGTTYADWLEISSTSQLFEVASGGVMRFTSGVANKLLDFCRWLQDDAGIESDGESVGNGAAINIDSTIYNPSEIAYTGDAYAEVVSSDTVRFVISEIRKNTNSPIFVQCTIPIDARELTISYSQGDISSDIIYNASLEFYDSDGTNLDSLGSFGLTPNGTSRTLYPQYDFLVLRLRLGAGYNPRSGFAQFHVSTDNLSTPDTARITPSDFVNIPASIDSDTVFALKPSVDIALGDSVDDASEAILDGITSEDGLSSTVEDTPDTSWGWLYTLLSNIAGTIGAGVSDIKDKLDGIKGSADNAASAAQGAASASQGAATAAQGAASAAQDAATAAQGVQDAVEGMQSTAEGIEDNTATIARNLAPATYGNAADYQLDLTSLFPFCIPRDIYTAIGLLVAEPEAPSIDWDMPLPNGSTYHIEYDLSEWDGIASLLRHLELLLYGVGLMMATKSIIKW